MAEVAVVVVAAGRGERAGGGKPKQFRRIGDETMLRRCLLMLVDAPNVGLVQPVIRPEDQALFDAAADKIAVLPPAFGGATRQASVRAGLEALAERKPDIVLVHDAARPFATPALVARAIDAAEKTGAAVPGLPVTDTIKAVDDGGFVAQTLDRSRLRAIQTPQGFAFAPLLDSFSNIRPSRESASIPRIAIPCRLESVPLPLSGPSRYIRSSGTSQVGGLSTLSHSQLTADSWYVFGQCR